MGGVGGESDKPDCHQLILKIIEKIKIAEALT